MRLRLLLPVALFLLSWEGVSRSGFMNAALLPPPSKALVALVEMARSGELFTDMRASYGRLLAGWVLGTVAGIVIGLVTGRLAWAADFFAPIIQMFRPLPPVAMIPLIIVWFGIGETAKIFSIAFAVFFPVWLNTHAGAVQIPQKLLWCASTLTRSKLKTFFQIILPAALPFISAGVRIGISSAFVMVFVSELTGASEGIGYQINTGYLSYRIDRMMAALAVLAASGALADFLFVKGMVRFCPWLNPAQSK